MTVREYYEADGWNAGHIFEKN